jgi:hypothetical protein
MMPRFGQKPNAKNLAYAPPMFMGMFGAGLVVAGLLMLQQAAKMYSSKSLLTPFRSQPSNRPRP